MQPKTMIFPRTGGRSFMLGLSAALLLLPLAGCWAKKPATAARLAAVAGFFAQHPASGSRRRAADNPNMKLRPPVRGKIMVLGCIYPEYFSLQIRRAGPFISGAIRGE